MYCRRCGTENPPDSAYCVSCGEQMLPPGGPGAPPPQAGPPPGGPGAPPPQAGPPPGYAQPGYQPPGYPPQQPGYGPPPPSPHPPKKSAAGLVIALASVGVLLVGIGVAFFAILGPNKSGGKPPRVKEVARTAKPDKPVPPADGTRGGVVFGGKAKVPALALPAAGTPRYRIFPRPHNPTAGPANALVTLIMVSDFQCPFCAGSVAAIEQARKAYPKELRVVFMHNPLSFHRDAELAARASQAAHKQGRFWPYHDLLFKNSKALKKPDLIRYASQVGLDVEKFKKDLDDRRVKLQVTQDSEQVTRLGARGTPSFFVNGVYLRGRKKAEKFKAVVAEELAHARKLLARGVTRAQLYRELLKGGSYKIASRRPKPEPYRPRPKRPEEDPSARYKVDITGRPYRGAKHAPVVITYFSEFQCPWCKRLEPKLDEVLEKYRRDVKIVWMDFPLRFHKQAMPAAIAAHEVFLRKGNRAFWKMHGKIFANNRSITPDSLARWARAAGARGSRVRGAVTSNKHENLIKQGMTTAQKIGVRGTPTILVNGKKFKGRRELGNFSEKIDAELRAAKGIIGRGGVTRKTYYAHLQKSALARVKYLAGGADPLARPKRKELDPDAVYKVELDGKSPSFGPKNALVTLVMWTDFQCPYCKFAACIVKLIRKAYPRDVRFVFKNNPLGFHKQAMPAALAARTAYEMKGGRAFWTFHDRLFPTSACASKAPMPHIREWLRKLPGPAPTMDRALFVKLARAAGLKKRRFLKALDARKYEPRIKAEQAQAVKLGARGTPAFFVNGVYIRGVRPMERMKQIIDTALKQAKQLMRSKGLKRSQVYRAIIANGATAPVYK